MLIGLISDIHANLAALEAVLKDMPRTDLLLCCGDVVGYYAQPNETCERLRASSALCVRGNHDAYVIGALEPNPDRREAYRTDWTRRAADARRITLGSSSFPRNGTSRSRASRYGCVTRAPGTRKPIFTRTAPGSRRSGWRRTSCSSSGIRITRSPAKPATAWS